MNNLNTSVSGRSRISDTHTCCSPEFSRNQSVFWPRFPPWRRQRREPWDVRAVGVPAAPSGRLTCPTSSTSSSPEMGQSNMQKALKMGQIQRDFSFCWDVRKLLPFDQFLKAADNPQLYSLLCKPPRIRCKKGALNQYWPCGNIRCVLSALEIGSPVGGANFGFRARQDGFLFQDWLDWKPKQGYNSLNVQPVTHRGGSRWHSR